MVLQTKLMTIQEFKEFVERPENSDKLFELINGGIIEVSPSRTRNSEIGFILGYAVYKFSEENNFPCHISTGDGAYDIQGHVVAPDFAYKPTPMSDDYPDPVAPLWTAEVISPTDKATDIRNKQQVYRDAKILYWEMYPQQQLIDIYEHGREKRTVGIDDTLDGGEVLPGFTIAAKVLFQ